MHVTLLKSRGNITRGFKVCKVFGECRGIAVQVLFSTFQETYQADSNSAGDYMWATWHSCCIHFTERCLD